MIPFRLTSLLCTWLGMTFASLGASEASWQDLYTGMDVRESRMLEDLGTADIIYVGEIHSDKRHHETQCHLLKILADQKSRPLALGLEQIESRYQSAVDKFNSGELTFDELAKEINWSTQWKNYKDYQALCELAQSLKIPVHGLNAPADTIRQIGREGLAKLDAEKRKEIPAEIQADHPQHRAYIQQFMPVHGGMEKDKERFNLMFEAQVCRDEAMADAAVKILNKDDQKRTLMVVTGQGHVSYGVGMPDRVKRRDPDVVERIVIVTPSRSGRRGFGGRPDRSNSSSSKPATADNASTDKKSPSHGHGMQRPPARSREAIRSLGRPAADYLRRYAPEADAANAGDSEEPIEDKEAK